MPTVNLISFLPELIHLIRNSEDPGTAAGADRQRSRPSKKMEKKVPV
jgi:hypothetical protein